MLRKLILLILFFGSTPIVLLLIFLFYSFQYQGQVLGSAISSQPSTIYAALPRENGAFTFSIKTDDAIPIILENYLRRYKSPLLPYVDLIIRLSSASKVDPRLIVAIAQQESNLGKNSPLDCYNAWGWGIHSQGTLCFSGWEEAIKTVTEGIASGYCAKGYCADPCLMMKKYTPNSNGSWCLGVKQFLWEMEFGDF